MRIRDAVASALHLFIVVFWLVVAGLSFLFPKQPQWQAGLIQMIQVMPTFAFYLGAAALVAALICIYGFYYVGRGRFMRYWVKPTLVGIDSNLIQEAVTVCFKQSFPHHVVHSEVALVDKQQLDVVVDIVPVDEASQERLMLQMEKELSILLRERFGCTHPCTISIRMR